MATKYIDLNLHAASIPSTYIPPGYLQSAGSGSGTTNILVGNPVVSPPGMSRISGYFTATGDAVVIPLGTEATRVRVMDMTDNVSWEWLRGLPATDSVKSVAAGTTTIDTTSGISVTTDNTNKSTVTIAAATAVNNSLLIFEIDC